MNKRYWLIRGYDSTNLIFEKKVKRGQFTEDQIRQLLQALAAKEGLSPDEIVGAYARRGTTISNKLLEVHKDFGQPTYMCSSNPHFVASVVDENGKILSQTPKRSINPDIAEGAPKPGHEQSGPLSHRGDSGMSRR